MTRLLFASLIVGGVATSGESLAGPPQTVSAQNVLITKQRDLPAEEYKAVSTQFIHQSSQRVLRQLGKPNYVNLNCKGDGRTCLRYRLGQKGFLMIFVKNGTVTDLSHNECSTGVRDDDNVVDNAIDDSIELNEAP